MKKNKFFNCIFLLTFIVISYTSCKKTGEEIEYSSFSTLALDATIGSGAKLLLQVDGKTTDTLKSSGSYKIKLESGDRKVRILDAENKLLVDTVLSFEKHKTVALSRFLYTGTALLFADPDLTRKPASPGNVLLRFVTTAQTLPEVMNIEIVLFYTQAGARKIIPMNKTINGVRKDRFSDYIELPNPNTLWPSGVTSSNYAIIGTNAVTGERVMGIDVVTTSPINNYATIRYSSVGTLITFIPNNIVSLGIAEPQSTATKIRQTTAIFERVATQ